MFLFVCLLAFIFGILFCFPGEQDCDSCIDLTLDISVPGRVAWIIYPVLLSRGCWKVFLFEVLYFSVWDLPLTQ